MKNNQEVPYNEFIDYKTGQIKKGLEYWFPLSKGLNDYLNHPESKFEEETGLLTRKHISTDEVVYIGKETKNIDLQYLEN